MRILKPLKAIGMVDGTTYNSPSATKAREVNVFAILGSEPHDSQDDDQSQQVRKTEIVFEASEIAQAAPVLDDDELGQWIELSIFIYVSQALNYDFEGRVDCFRKWIHYWNA
jgi:hypothetical protein